jgi:uncharacterized protein YutE (UPF0331/DUF86 family)
MKNARKSCETLMKAGRFMKNDVILNKISVIERCIKRIHEEYENNPKNLENYTKQDSIILNLQRACEASIDLAMHMVAQKKLGLPQNSRDAFSLLEQHSIITPFLSQKMKALTFGHIDRGPYIFSTSSFIDKSLYSFFIIFPPSNLYSVSIRYTEGFWNMSMSVTFFFHLHRF